MADLDYVKLWTTLMRAGINQRFSQIRSEFFMKIATSGPKRFQGKEDLDRIVAESKDLTEVPEFKELLECVINPHDQFKHYYYETTDGGARFSIEYFANVDAGISKEFIDYLNSGKFPGVPKIDNPTSEYNIDGYCLSTLYKNVPDDAEDTEDTEDNDDTETRINSSSTAHLIIIGEGSNSVKPDNYPSIIKHELTHACLFELREIIKMGYYDVCRVPATWTDAEILQWRDDINMLRDVLDSGTLEGEVFSEFVCEFLMYESDGQTKEKNPIMESRVPRTTKPDAKPKITYRTLTPLDRFEEHLEAISSKYRDKFEEIVNALRPLYDKYDEFLDSVKM